MGCALACSSLTPANAQQDPEVVWNVPWTIVGDSAYQADRNEKFVVTGKILSANTGQPVSSALVSADFLKFYDYSDDRGNYALEVPAGEYKVRVKRVGMRPAYYRIRVFSNGQLNIHLAEGVVELTEVLITSRPLDDNVKQSLSGLTRMNVDEIRTLPALMGEVDIVKSLQLMPGVTSVGEGTSALNVRGGRVDQNLVLMNGVPLLNISHALGFVPVFSQDIIEDFTLYKGNVPADLGGRASSVIEINTRRGNFEQWRFQGGSGPLTSRFSAEGPVLGSRSSLLLAGRIAHGNWLLRKVADPDVSNSRVSFHDTYLNFAHRFSENSSVDITLYGSDDAFTLSDRFGYDWSNYLLSARWRSLADRKASPTLSASYGYFRNELFDPSGADASRISNLMRYFQIQETVNYLPADGHDVAAGISAVAYLPGDEQRSGYAGNPAVVPKRAGKSSGLEWAAFVNDDMQLNDRISVSAGLRFSLYHHLGPDTVFRYQPGIPRSGMVTDTLHYKGLSAIESYGGLEPRLSLRFSLSNSKSLKLSYNRMRQYLHLISNTTAPTPVDLWQVSTRYIPPQKADNYSLGYFFNLKDNVWECSAELFYKRMSGLVEYRDFADLYLNDHLETELLPGRGRAGGGELLIRKLKGRLTGWFSYTYARTEVQVSSPRPEESINDGKWFPANYNKPHHANVVLNKQMRRRSAFSVILSYQTGRPYTAIESSYLAGATVVPVYSERNKYKIPDYFRADVSLTIGNVIRKINDSLVLAIYNLFGRENAYSVFYQRPAANTYIPRPYKLSVLGTALPSITYNFSF